MCTGNADGDICCPAKAYLLNERKHLGDFEISLYIPNKL